MLFNYDGPYVVNSGFNDQATPSIINGIDITPIIASMVLNWASETAGLLIIHGNGNVITIQIEPKRIISLALNFLSFIIFCNFGLY